MFGVNLYCSESCVANVPCSGCLVHQEQAPAGFYFATEHTEGREGKIFRPKHFAAQKSVTPFCPGQVIFRIRICLSPRRKACPEQRRRDAKFGKEIFS